MDNSKYTLDEVYEMIRFELFGNCGDISHISENDPAKGKYYMIRGIIACGEQKWKRLQESLKKYPK